MLGVVRPYSPMKELSILYSFPQGGDFMSVDSDTDHERKRNFELALQRQ